VRQISPENVAHATSAGRICHAGDKSGAFVPGLAFLRWPEILSDSVMSITE
jgi:hypothetical protein